MPLYLSGLLSKVKSHLHISLVVTQVRINSGVTSVRLLQCVCIVLYSNSISKWKLLLL